MHGTKKGLDPNLRPEWLVRKSQKPAEKSRTKKKEPDPLEQRSQIVDQVNSRQSRENILEQIYVPQKPIIPKYPIQKYPIPKLPERVIQNEKQTLCRFLILLVKS